MFVIAGCGWDRVERSTEIIWSDPEARLVLDTAVSGGFPDPLLTYSLRLEHLGRAPIVVAVSTTEVQYVHVSATRLANRHVAWMLNNSQVCEELGTGAISCNDFADLGCRIQPEGSPCCIDRAPDIGCSCATTAADPAAIASLLWAGDQPIDAFTRSGIGYALARLGHRDEAVHVIESTEGLIWGDAARVLLGTDPSALPSLRASYRSGSRCERDVIARACGPACTRS